VADHGREIEQLAKSGDTRAEFVRILTRGRSLGAEDGTVEPGPGVGAWRTLFDAPMLEADRVRDCDEVQRRDERPDAEDQEYQPIQPPAGDRRPLAPQTHARR
jgi:hypothetical protein